VGLIAGAVAGGRLEGLARIQFRWAPLALAALLVQVVQFDPAGGQVIGALGPAVYVASTLLVLVVVLRNIRVTGLPIVAAGAASNLAAIVANGGYMPADPGAIALAGLKPTQGPTNSVVLADPALRPLTDIFAIPAGVPFSNVFSVGDVLVGVGVAVAIAAAMRAARGVRPTPSAESVAAPSVDGASRT
jgi:hypothetical protein